MKPSELLTHYDWTPEAYAIRSDGSIISDRATVLMRDPDFYGIHALSIHGAMGLSAWCSGGRRDWMYYFLNLKITRKPIPIYEVKRIWESCVLDKWEGKRGRKKSEIIALCQWAEAEVEKARAPRPPAISDNERRRWQYVFEKVQSGGVSLEKSDLRLVH